MLTPSNRDGPVLFRQDRVESHLFEVCIKRERPRTFGAIHHFEADAVGEAQTTTLVRQKAMQRNCVDGLGYPVDFAHGQHLNHKITNRRNSKAVLKKRRRFKDNVVVCEKANARGKERIPPMYGRGVVAIVAIEDRVQG